MAGTYEKPNTSRVNIVPVWQENGAGVMGLATRITLLPNKTNLKIVIAEKENEIAKDALGRNSDILGAGFYYSTDSLKA